MATQREIIEHNAGRIAAAFIGRNSSMITEELVKRSTRIAILLNAEVERQLRDLGLLELPHEGAKNDQ